MQLKTSNYIPEVDLYIERSADFARPVLIYLRHVIHQAWPGIEEKIKWGFPHFDEKGTVCSMAAFKQHCAFGFWKASIMRDPEEVFKDRNDAMGSLGQIKSLADLPPEEILVQYIRQAVQLNLEAKKLPAKTKNNTSRALIIPEDFKIALEQNQEAKRVFDHFNYTNQKEYIEWFNEAKTDLTRSKRIITAIEWLAEGKIRNWKYIKQ